MRKIRTRSWVLGTFAAIAFCLMIVSAVLAPSAHPVGPFEDISGVVVSSQVASASGPGPGPTDQQADPS